MRPVAEIYIRGTVIRAVFFDFDTVFAPDGGLHPGADAFMRACAGRFPILVTAGIERTRAERALRSHDLHSTVLDVLTAAEVEKPKPAPDLLIAGLGRIGFLLRDRNPVEPNECLVVDSSRAGVEAARAAGMRSLAIANGRSSAQLISAADFVRDSFAAVNLDDVLRRCATPASQ
jgi:beta-phosphoglucomutase-like phosphatase (HAD superfamily)